MPLLRYLILLFFLNAFHAGAQTIGGSTVFNFLRLPSNALLTATGGVNTSYYTNEAGFSSNNPAILNPSLHSQLNLSFNGFLGGIKTYSATGVHHHEKLNTTFSGHIYFVDYGSIPQTDAAGNVSGNFRPIDFTVQIGAGRKYLEKWHYGANLKFIQSSYGQYKSNGIALDFGILYRDSANDFTASLLAKNMGFQIGTYNGVAGDLPFDLQIGFTKRLSKSPFGFSVTAQQAHRFNIYYEDTVFNNENDITANSSFFNKLTQHFVVASHVYLGKNLEATIGYNHLRRSELNVANSANGLTGFSMGLRLKFQKLQVLYARSSYQKNIAYNQIGITMQMNQFFGNREL
jgi:hypothetical protein